MQYVWRLCYLEGTVLVPSDLVVAVAVAVQRREHDAEGAGPLAEEDEEMVPQRLLREEEAPVVDCRDSECERHKVITVHRFNSTTTTTRIITNVVIYQEHTG